MGRVYKALVKADRWNDRDRPIGRPAESGDTIVHDRPKALSFNNPLSANARPPDVVELAALPLSAGLLDVSSVVESQGPPSAPATNGATRWAVSRTSCSSPEPPIFREPNETLKLSDLSVDQHLAALTNADPVAAERFRELGAKLLNLAERRKLKTVLVTSAEASEGKTTVAVNLAWSLAQRPGLRVLLIDVSLAASSVSNALGIAPNRGWLDAIDGSCAMTDAIVRLDPNGLYILTPGPQAASRSADSVARSIEQAVTELKSHFDILLVDSAPILESSDTQQLADVLDGTVIVARAGRTYHTSVSAARKQVRKERRLGIVLNDADSNTGISLRKRKKIFGRMFRRNR